MKEYCKTKRELIKEIEEWIDNLEGTLKIRIKKDMALKGTYEVRLRDIKGEKEK